MFWLSIMIIERFVVPPIDNNTYLIIDDTLNQAAVIDPSLGSEVILNKIKETDVNVTHLLNTHGHPDHTCDNSIIKEVTESKFMIHKLDAYFLLENQFAKNKSLAKVDKFFIEDEIIKIGKIEVKVIHTPGHSEGSCCFYIPREKILFSGDTLFEGSFGRVDLLGCDPNKMFESLTKLSKLPKDVKVYPGHGYPTTIGNESWINNQDLLKSMINR